ncbi:MAG: hypothetical protein ACTSP8_09165 [Promethearchaeota archaeon]
MLFFDKVKTPFSISYKIQEPVLTAKRGISIASSDAIPHPGGQEAKM